MDYDEHWDTAKAEALVAEHREVMEKLEAIGLLPDVSCRGVDRALVAQKTV